MNETQSDRLRLALRRFEFAAYALKATESLPLDGGGSDERREELYEAREAIVSLVAGMLTKGR